MLGSSARLIGPVTPEAPRKIKLAGESSPAAPQPDDEVVGQACKASTTLSWEVKKNLWGLKMLPL
ncbi:MAG: hypothetical protein PVG71_13135, partial [Anaerolineae bacterium]